MVSENLETAIRRVGNPVDFLRNSQYPAFEFPVRPEFSNWRSEQMAWRETVVLLDQSHHMSNLFISGPDALKGLSDHAVNSFANFGPGRAKQYVAANSDGYFIGDGILFHMEDGSFDLVSNPSIINWVQYHLETAATMSRYGATTIRTVARARRSSIATSCRGRTPSRLWKPSSAARCRR